MDGFYQAQANVMLLSQNILKGQSITKEFYNALPDKMKVKFLFVSGPQVPLALNQLIGDNAEEKAKRDKLSKEKTKKGK